MMFLMKFTILSTIVFFVFITEIIFSLFLISLTFSKGRSALIFSDDINPPNSYSDIYSFNVSGEIPYLENLFNILDDNFENGLLILNYIINGLGEILGLSQVFDFELYDVFEYLMTRDHDSRVAVVLLNAREKFETLTENDEYLFDEDKNTKNEVQDIKKLILSTDKKSLLAKVNLELKEDSLFVYTALDFATDLNMIRELLKCNNQTIILKTAEVLKGLGNLDDTAKTVALLKVTDDNIKSIIRAL